MKRSVSEAVPKSGKADGTCASANISSCDEALVRAFQILGKRWLGVILGNLTGGPLGFAELGRRVEGIGDSVLAERLSDLQRTGLIVREVQSGPPVSVMYRLTPAGIALIPALHELSVWASQNLPCASKRNSARSKLTT